MAVLSAVEAKVWLFHLQASRSTRGSLSVNVIRSYFEDLHFYAAIWREKIDLYDFHTHKAKRQLLFCVNSGYIQVDRTTVLVVGVEVKTLDLLTLQVTPLAPLLTPRNYRSGSGGQHCVCLWRMYEW